MRAWAVIMSYILAFPIMAQDVTAQDFDEGKLLLGLILQDNTEKIELYLSANSIPLLPNVSLFKTAIYRGNKRIVEAFFKAGANAKEPGLICAAISDASTTKMLIEHGVDIQGKECGGLSPLQKAVKGGFQEVIQILLTHGAEASGATEKAEISALLDASMLGNVPIMKMLIERGATLSPEDIEKATQRLCLSGNVDALILLKEKGVAPDYDGCYLALAQTAKFNSDLLAWLKRQSKIKQFVVKGQPLLNAAASRGNLEMVKLLIGSGAKTDTRDPHYQYSALGAAINPENASQRDFHLDVAELLLTHGADPNALDGKRGRTLLEGLADTAFCSTTDDPSTFYKERLDAAKLLINHKANVNIKNKSGLTPLHHAAQAGNPLMVQLLLEHGADVDASTNGGITPLYSIFSAYSGCAATKREALTVEILVAHGADTELVILGKTMFEVIDKNRPGSGDLLAVLTRLTADRLKQSRFKTQTEK